VRSGFWSAGLEEHAESCATCSEVRAVTEALIGESARLSIVTRASEAGLVWKEARRRARLHLRHRAELWFRALRALTGVYAVASFAWLLSHSHGSGSGVWRPSFHVDFASLVTGPAESFAAVGLVLAAVCISMGCWYLLREARQPLETSPSR
jgi:hypothetical protein